MINTGAGVTHTNGLVAALNIPTMHHKTFHEREKEMGKHVVQVAEQSCANALEEEKQLVREKKQMPETEPVGLSVSFDGGWSTRRSGSSYNSDTGHAALIGEGSRKCLNFGVKSRRCRICEVAEKESRKPTEHPCYKSWSGSSKAMEPALGVDMITNM
jgi:hypothetical protein